VIEKGIEFEREDHIRNSERKISEEKIEESV
jgi:hypothetical protein